MAILISTIVDQGLVVDGDSGLYGHFNFYYCRSNHLCLLDFQVYMAILISTIVDGRQSDEYVGEVYMAILISTIDVNLTKLPQTLRR